jgi:hypothetical protein
MESIRSKSMHVGLIIKIDNIEDERNESAGYKELLFFPVDLVKN